MSDLIDAARDVQACLELQNLRFCFIGGLAVLRWGAPRLTKDVDVTVLCPFGSEDSVSAPMLASGYTGRIADVREFARRSRVILIQTPDGVPIDIALGALPYEEKMIERSSVFEYAPGIGLRTCSAEDLVVLKLFAFRARDLSDAETVVERQGRGLDWQYIEASLEPLAEIKGQAEIMTTLRRLRGADV